jgi:hypothetical protein
VTDVITMRRLPWTWMRRSRSRVGPATSWCGSWLSGPAPRGCGSPGEGGLLSQLTKVVVESALDGELDDHLGYASTDRPAGTAAIPATASAAKPS